MSKKQAVTSNVVALKLSNNRILFITFDPLAKSMRVEIGRSGTRRPDAAIEVEAGRSSEVTSQWFWGSLKGSLGLRAAFIFTSGPKKPTNDHDRIVVDEIGIHYEVSGVGVSWFRAISVSLDMLSTEDWHTLLYAQIERSIFRIRPEVVKLTEVSGEKFVEKDGETYKLVKVDRDELGSKE